MNGIWTNQGLEKIKDSILLNSSLKINKFVLSGTSDLVDLRDFTENSAADYDSFPDKISELKISSSEIDDKGCLNIRCEVPADLDRSFYCNGIGLIHEDRMGRKFLMSVSEIPNQQHCIGVVNVFEIKLPVLADVSDIIVDFKPGDRVDLNQVKDDIKNHNQSNDSHEGISLDLNLVLKGLNLNKIYNKSKMEFELFLDNWTLLGKGKADVISGVSGDDSIDVENSLELKTGYYIVSDSSKMEVIRITEKLNNKRLRLAENLQNTYGASAVISKTTFKDHDKGEVSVNPGEIYFSKDINLGSNDKPKSLTIRRTKTNGNLDLFIKRETDSDFRKIEYKWKRSINEAYVEYEYEFSAIGSFIFKLTIKDHDFKIKHIVLKDKATGLKGVHNPPLKPVNLFPVDKSIDIPETPTLSIAGYSHPLGTPQKSIQVQVSEFSNFSPLVIDKKVPGLSFSVNPGKFEINTFYYFRARVEDQNNGISEWSEPTGFTTKSSFKHVITPVNTSPSHGSIDVSETPTISSGAFEVHGGSDSHVKTEWRIRKEGKTWNSPVYHSGETEDLISHEIPAGCLKEGETIYYWQVRYKGQNLGWSEWSQETSFITKAVFASIVGIALVQSGVGAGTWHNIDGKGDKINPDKALFNNHPVYRNISDVLIDHQAMVKIPKFYVKAETILSGELKGKKVWMISDIATKGFSLHPAFKDKNQDLDHFYIGKFEATADINSGVGSKKGVMPLEQLSLDSFKSRISKRNTGGVDGFHMLNIHELSAIQILCLIENGGSDVQSNFGKGNVHSSSLVNTGSSDSIWRGIHEFWGNARCLVDGIIFDPENEIKIFSSDGSKSYIRTGVKTQNHWGWVTDLLTEKGKDFDLGLIFLGEAFTNDKINQILSDKQFLSKEKMNTILCHGGHRGSDNESGLFWLNAGINSTRRDLGTGSRISKI